MKWIQFTIYFVIDGWLDSLGVNPLSDVSGFHANLKYEMVTMLHYDFSKKQFQIKLFFHTRIYYKK